MPPAGCIQRHIRSDPDRARHALEFRADRGMGSRLGRSAADAPYRIGASRLSAAGAFLKGVIRAGSLHDDTPGRDATEFGVLLPDSSGRSPLGASLAGTVSQRWDWGAIHLNGAATLTREHRGDIFLGTIVEGPGKSAVRPVAEVFYERNSGRQKRYRGSSG